MNNYTRQQKKKWGLVSKLPIWDTDNKIAGLVGSFVDITDRTKTEKTQNLLMKCLNSMYDGILLQSFDSKTIFYHNSALEDIYGYKKEDILKLTDNPLQFWLENCVHPDFKKIEEKFFLAKQWPESRKCKIIRPDGQIRWIHTTITKEHYNNQECHLSIISDITDQVKSEEKIRNLLRIMDKVDQCLWMGKFDKLKILRLVMLVNILKD